MTLSEHIDQLLHEAENGHADHPTRGSSAEYEKAFDKARRHGLVEPISKMSYELTLEGERALELGGFDKWKEYQQSRESQRYATIHVSGGNAVIGNNNSGVNQGQDGTLINSGSRAHIVFNESGFQKLAQTLLDNQVAQPDIDELKTILATDEPNEEKGLFGPGLRGWIVKMTSKSLEGSWAVGIGAAGSLLAEAIKHYYGWH